MKKTSRVLSVILTFILLINTTSLCVLNASAAGSLEYAIQWAVNIANDDSHGYSQTNRNGPDYDCSSLVSTAFSNAGFGVSGSLNTRNMKEAFVSAGFIWIDGSSIPGFPSSAANLQRGDIVLDEGTHVELYLGNNQLVGAHSDYGYPATGDYNGKEISVGTYYGSSSSVKWDGVLRYPTSAPTTASLSMDKYEVRAGSEFSFFCTSDAACSYYMSIHRESGEKVFEGWVSSTYTTSFLSCDKYSAHISATNSYGGVDSNWVEFYVYGEPPTTASLTIPKTVYTLGESVTFTNWSDTYYARYYMSIYCYDDENPDGYLYDSGYKPVNYTITPSVSGHYAAHTSAYTVDGAVDSNWVSFDVEKESYDIKYNANGGTGAPENQTKIKDVALTLSEDIPEKDGTKFLGWATAENANNAEFQPGDIYTGNKSLTLYAVWCEHSFYEEVIKSANCVKTGEEKYTCSACGYEYTELIPVDNDVHTGNIVVKNQYDAKCEVAGCTGDTYCVDCDALLLSGEILPVLGHDEQITVTAPTCTEQGYITHTCSRCDYNLVDTFVDAKGHCYTSRTAKEATCDEDGCIEYLCSCGDSYTETIPSTGHAFNENNICENCGYSEEVINCNHLCHKDGFVGFFWKIIRLFWKLFGMNPVCECGMAHY